MRFSRELVKGSTGLVVLSLLQERPMYGYEIVQVVNERTGGRLTWKEGSLYPCLHRLETDGYVSSRWQEASNGRRRKYYRLTSRGRTALASRTKEWVAFSGAVNVLLWGAKA